jgi:hypothetical protein
VTVFAGILVRKISLEGVGHPLSVWPKLIAPHIRFARKATTRSKLPLRLGGKSLASPFCVGFGVFIGNVHNRIFIAAFETGFRALWMFPVGPAYVGPPLEVVVEWHCVTWRCEHNRTGDEIVWRGAGEVFRAGFSLGDRLVPRGYYEVGELFVRHVRFVHPESIYIHTMNRTRIASRLHANFASV